MTSLGKFGLGSVLGKVFQRNGTSSVSIDDLL